MYVHARVHDFEVHCTVAVLHTLRTWKTIYREIYNASCVKTVLTRTVYRRATSVIFIAEISYSLQSRPGVYILHKGVHSSRGYNYSWIKWKGGSKHPTTLSIRN